jgi:Uma2 family endonuclease
MSVTIDTSRVWTYADLLALPEDGVRREVIDGELVVTRSPSVRHQDAVLCLGAALRQYTIEHGGRVFVAPLDVYFDDTNVVEPDVLYVKPQHVDRLEERRLVGPPDLVVEVSSPSTRRIDVVRKRRLYETRGVPEYWLVDLDAERIEVYRLRETDYGEPIFFVRDEAAETPQAPGFTISVDEVLGEAGGD